MMKNFTTVIVIVCLHLSYCQCQSGFYCLRDEEDFLAEGWDDFYQSSTYAATAADLPAIFQGKIEGEGIFYFDGVAGLGDQNIANYPPNLEEPAYLYVKYYAHNETVTSAEPYVLPAKYPDNGFNYYLKLEDDFQWKEEVVPIDVTTALQAGIASGIYTVIAGDYYLIDTMVIAYGGNINPDEVVDLCPPKTLQTTTTSTVTPPTTTTSTPPTTTTSTPPTTTTSTSPTTTTSTPPTTTTSTPPTTTTSTPPTTTTSTPPTTTTSTPPTTTTSTPLTTTTSTPPTTPDSSNTYTTQDTGTVPTVTGSSGDGGLTTGSSTSNTQTTTTTDPALPPIVAPPGNEGLEPYAVALVSFFSLLILLLLLTIFYYILTRRRRRRRQDSNYSESQASAVIPIAIPRPSYTPSIDASPGGNLDDNLHSAHLNSQQARPSDATYVSSSNLLSIPGGENGLMNRRLSNMSNLSRASARSTYSGVTSKDWVIPRLARD